MDGEEWEERMEKNERKGWRRMRGKDGEEWEERMERNERKGWRGMRGKDGDEWEERIYVWSSKFGVQAHDRADNRRNKKIGQFVVRAHDHADNWFK